MKLFRLLQTAYRTTCEIEELSNVPSVTCNEELNAEYIKSVESLENPGTTINGGFHVMGSEDFAVISAKNTGKLFCSRSRSGRSE